VKNYRSLKKFLNWAWGSKKGFTLAEVMVAAGLVGVLSVALVNIMGNLGKTSKKMQQDAELIQLKLYAARLLNKETACTRSFGGLTLSSAGTNVPAIFPNATQPALFSAGTTLGQAASVMEIQSIDIRGWQDTATPPTFDIADAGRYTQWGVGANLRRRGTARVAIMVEKGRAAVADAQKQKSSYGNVVVPVYFNLQVVVNSANVIQSCYGDQSEYVAAACDAVGGRIDDLGRCVEYEANNHNAAPGEPAFTVNGTAGAGTEVGSTANVPLEINGGDAGQLQIDGDEIQSSTEFRLNIHGQNIAIGTNDNTTTTTVRNNFVAVRDVNLGSDGSANTITIGNAGDTVNISPTTNISGTTTFTTGTVTSNDATTMTLNSNTINLGDDSSDYVNIRGRIRNNSGNLSGRVYVEDELQVTSNTYVGGNETVTGNSTVNNRIYLPNVSSGTTLTNKMVPNVEWIANRIARTLAPEAGNVASMLTDIIANSTSNDTSLNVVREYVCDSIRINNISGAGTTNGGSGCTFSTPDTNCSQSGRCSQVCIGTQCRSNWNISVSQTSRTSCSYVAYIYSYNTVNPSNSTAGTSGYSNYLCPANEMVNGVARRYWHFSSGVHGWRSYLYCCAPVIN
jgi:prepilin-type N-terminal cleavage/methylation domain-containing protein